jgi:ATP-dependent Lhr-like helicase
VGADSPDREGLLKQVIRQLEGLYLPAQLWESTVFPARIPAYSPEMLDRLCSQGAVFWRVRPEGNEGPISLAWYGPESQFDVASAAADSTGDELATLNALKTHGACFTHVLATRTGLKTSVLLNALESLVRRGLVVNDSFSSIRFILEKDELKTLEQKARRIALSVSRMEMGRWEAAVPVLQGDAEAIAGRLLRRYGLVSKEVLEASREDIPWSEVYEALKQRENLGTALRGYFVEGVSGIQFMLPEAYRRLGGAATMTVLSACDPAQAYGRVVPHSSSDMDFTNVPATAVVLDGGVPSAVLERYGERVSVVDDEKAAMRAVLAFKEAFLAGRVWPGRRRVNVKEWPEERERELVLKAKLAEAGFEMTVQGMALRKS